MRKNLKSKGRDLKISKVKLKKIDLAVTVHNGCTHEIETLPTILTQCRYNYHLSIFFYFTFEIFGSLPLLLRFFPILQNQY